MLLTKEIASPFQSRLNLSEVIKNYHLPEGIIFNANPLEADLLKSSFLVRLEDIRQLGLAYKVYPGASHSRFEHSMGAAHFATQMFDVLMHKYQNVLLIPVEVADYYRQKLRLLMLMHDTGHAPGSHMFERASQLAHQEFDHEKQTEKNIDSDEFQTLLKKHSFQLTEINPVLERLIFQIKDSVIDADKMDYLYRDAHHCGIDARFDRNRLIDRLELSDAHGDINIAVEDGGANAFIEMILMRRRMFDSLYFNDHVSIYENHLERFLAQHLDQTFLDNPMALSDSDIHLLLKKHAANNVDAQAILRKNPFVLMMKFNQDETLKNEKLYQKIFAEKFGENNVIMFQSKIKPHNLLKEPLFVVDKKHPDTNILEAHPILKQYQNQVFWRIYVNPDFESEARILANQHFR